MSQSMNKFLAAASSHHDSSNPNHTRAQIAQMRFNAESSLPKEDDLLANLFSESKETLGQNPKGWRALASGVMSGLEHGARKASLLERKDDLAKYNRVMDYLEEANHHAAERIEWYQKRDMAKTKIMPSVNSYVDNMKSLDPQSRQIMAQSILDTWNKTTGDSYKFLAIDAVNPLQMAVTDDTGKILPIDLMDLASSDELMSQRIAMRMPEFLKMEQMERQKLHNEERRIAQADEGIALREKELLAQYPHMNGGQKEPYKDETGSYTPFTSMSKHDIKTYTDTVNKEYGDIKKLDAMIDAGQKMIHIFEKHPDIGSYYGQIISANKDPGLINSTLRKITDKKSLAAVEELRKYSSQIGTAALAASGISAKGLNQWFEKQNFEASPNGMMTQEGFMNVMAPFIANAKKMKDRAIRGREASDHHYAYRPYEMTDGDYSEKRFGEDGNQENNEKDNTAVLVTDGKDIYQMETQEELKEYLAKGFKQIEQYG